MNEIEKELLEKAILYKKEKTLYNIVYSDNDMSDFHNLKIINKVDLMNDQDMYPPFGSIVEKNNEKLCRIHRTSGTTTKPLMLALTKNDINNIIATGKKAFINSGLNSDDIIVNCMNYCMWMGGFMDHQCLEATGATVIPYGVGNTENLIELIMSIPGICIHATPSYLSRIEFVARDKFGLSPKELKIKKGFFGGEGGLDNPMFRNRLEQKWNMDIYNANYGMSEVMSVIASEGKEKNGLRFIASDVLYPELYLENEKKASNKYLKPGYIGRLVLSNKCKESQPLLRYDTGDVIEVLSSEIDNDNVYNFTFKVVGRVDDMIVVRGINFYPKVIRNILSNFEGITGNYQVQILKEGIIDYVRLLVEKNSNITELESLKKSIETSIRIKYFVTCDVKFVDAICKDDNKLKMIKKVDRFE